jgi:hypothetical protein
MPASTVRANLPKVLALLHDEKAAAQPQQGDNAGDQAATNAEHATIGRVTTRIAATATTWTPGSTAEQAAELLIEVAPEFIEIGRTVVAAVASHQDAGRRSWPDALQAAAPPQAEKRAGKLEG